MLQSGHDTVGSHDTCFSVTCSIGVRSPLPDSGLANSPAFDKIIRSISAHPAWRTSACLERKRVLRGDGISNHFPSNCGLGIRRPRWLYGPMVALASDNDDRWDSCCPVGGTFNS